MLWRYIRGELYIFASGISGWENRERRSVFPLKMRKEDQDGSVVETTT